MPVVVVTDSTSDLSPGLCKAMNIRVVPLWVVHATGNYLDGIDITPEKFYPLLENSADLPTTSQPSPQQFLDVYVPLVEAGYQIVSVHISSGFSGTLQSALSAREMLGKGEIHVVDSASISYGLGFLALEAARLAENGFDAAEIVRRLESLKAGTDVMFTIDTLTYLHKGGRIGKAACLLGNLLRVKPLIKVEDGVLVPAGRCRSSKQALEEIARTMGEKFRGQKVRAAVGHGMVLDKAEALAELLSGELDLVEPVHVFQVGSVIGVHTGPSVVGAFVCPAGL